MQRKTTKAELKLFKQFKTIFEDNGIKLSSASFGRCLRKVLIENEKFIERIDKVMKNFSQTDSDIQKIIEMNDGLLKQFRLVYDSVLYIKHKLDADLKEKTCQFLGYDIKVEYFFGYNRTDGIKTADYDILTDMSDHTQYMFPNVYLTNESEEILSFEEFVDYNPKLSWNIGCLNLPGLENHYIYKFMHWIFDDAGTFCVADIPYLSPEDLQWQVNVNYEFFKD